MVHWFRNNLNKETLLEKLHNKFQEFISYLIFNKHWEWLEFIISLMCDVEMQWPLLFDSEFRKAVNSADIIWIQPKGNDESIAEREIPKNTLYCEGCVFREISKVAMFFYGYQACGYCYYLGKGDFSFVRPTDILWDGCKCCGIGEEDIDIFEGENNENREN